MFYIYIILMRLIALFVSCFVISDMIPKHYEYSDERKTEISEIELNLPATVENMDSAYNYLQSQLISYADDFKPDFAAADSILHFAKFDTIYIYKKFAILPVTEYEIIRIASFSSLKTIEYKQSCIDSTLISENVYNMITDEVYNMTPFISYNALVHSLHTKIVIADDTIRDASMYYNNYHRSVSQ